MLDHLASQLFSDIREKLSAFDDNSPNSASTIKALIEARLRDLNLVTREEFDAQSEVLARTRQKLEVLEASVNALENKDTKT